jgi:hypothetical protein
MERCVTDAHAGEGQGVNGTFGDLLEAYAAEQRETAYPDLFTPVDDEPLAQRVRVGASLVTTVLRHGDLTRRQRAALGVFRLQQFALCDWYDLSVVVDRGLLVDPSLSDCPDDTIHIVVGSPADHRVLAYFCLQPVPAGEEGGRFGRWRRPPDPREPRMADGARPLFPSEREQCGPEVFASLPGLAALPIARVYELVCVLSNRVAPSPLTFAALCEAFYTVSWLCEAFYTVSSLVRGREIGMDALIGVVDLEARRVVARLGVPVLYAPLARPTPVEHVAIWSRDALEPGRFWPFVIATADLHRHAAWFARLDEALDADAAHLRRALVDLLKHPSPTRPRAFVSGASGPGRGYFWTDDPLFAGEPVWTPRPLAAVPVPAGRG